MDLVKAGSLARIIYLHDVLLAQIAIPLDFQVGFLRIIGCDQFLELRIESLQGNIERDVHVGQHLRLRVRGLFDEELVRISFQAIADFLDEPVEKVTEIYTRQAHQGRSLRERANGDCVFYDKAAGCTIYPVRPRQCRTWPFWESNIKTVTAWEHTCKICPGSGQGELIPVEEITRRLNVIRL